VGLLKESLGSIGKKKQKRHQKKGQNSVDADRHMGVGCRKTESLKRTTTKEPRKKD